MRAKIKDGELCVDVQELLGALDDKGRADAARFLVADKYLFAAVLDCVRRAKGDDVAGGDGRYFDDDEAGAWWFDPRTVLELREKLIPMMPEIARAAVVEALKQRNNAIADERRISAWAWKMFHAWHSRGQEAFPDGPPPIPRQDPEPVTDAEVNALMGSQR